MALKPDPTEDRAAKFLVFYFPTQLTWVEALMTFSQWKEEEKKKKRTVVVIPLQKPQGKAFHFLLE